MSDTPTLTDGVVTIRAHRPEDARRVWEQCQDPVSQAWTTVPIPYSTAMAEEFVNRTMPGRWGDDTEWGFAIEVDGAYGGTCSLRNEGAGRGEIAYGSHPDIRGTGAVEQALRLMLAWAFAATDLEMVIWWAHRGNWASRKAAWRLGFTIEGSVRHWLPQRGALKDAWVGTLLRDDPREPTTTWLTCPVLKGAGLRLRPLTPDDAPRVAQACADARTQHWLGGLPSPYTLDDAHRWIESRSENLATGFGCSWAVTEPSGPEGDRLLGAISWFHWTPEVEAEIGYWMHPASRGRGVMSRALRVVTGHLVDDIGLQRVTAFAAVDNAASRHVIESAGFRPYGVERLGCRVRDGWADMALYDVTAGEWRQAADGPS